MHSTQLNAIIWLDMRLTQLQPSPVVVVDNVVFLYFPITPKRFSFSPTQAPDLSLAFSIQIQRFHVFGIFPFLSSSFSSFGRMNKNWELQQKPYCFCWCFSGGLVANDINLCISRRGDGDAAFPLPPSASSFLSFLFDSGNFRLPTLECCRSKESGWNCKFR